MPRFEPTTSISGISDTTTEHRGILIIPWNRNLFQKQLSNHIQQPKYKKSNLFGISLINQFFFPQERDLGRNEYP